MICNKNNLFLISNKAKQTFAKPPKFGCINEDLSRIYTSYGQVYEKTTKRKTTDKRTAKGKL
jgi:hypothetical protein